MLVQQAENTWWEKDDVFFLDCSENRQDQEEENIGEQIMAGP